MSDVVPPRIRERLAEFLLDRKTGNLILNIKDGKILGARLEELLPGD